MPNERIAFGDPIVVWLSMIIGAILLISTIIIALYEIFSKKENIVYRCTFYSGFICVLLLIALYSSLHQISIITKGSFYLVILSSIFIVIDLIKIGCSNFKIVLTLSIPAMLFFVLVRILAKPHLIIDRNVALIGIIVTGDLMITSIAGLIWEYRNEKKQTLQRQQ